MRTNKNTHCVIGNHDYFLLSAAKYINHWPKDITFKTCTKLDEAHPAKDLYKHQQIAPTISFENIKYLASLPLYQYADKITKQILVCHAGIVPNPEILIENQEDHHLMTIRNIKIKIQKWLAQIR